MGSTIFAYFMNWSPKHIAAFPLVALMVIKMMGMPIAWLNYQMNKDYIAAELCENRSRPQVHCNGQCVLMKKIAKANESNESKETKAASTSSVVDFCEETEDLSFRPTTSSLPYFGDFLGAHYSTALINGIFHPPAVTA